MRTSLDEGNEVAAMLARLEANAPRASLKGSLVYLELHPEARA